MGGLGDAYVLSGLEKEFVGEDKIKEDEEEDLLLLLYITPTSYNKDAVCSCK